MEALDVLDLLEQTPGKNDKVKILKDNKSLDLCELLLATFDFNVKYHIKKFDMPISYEDGLPINHVNFMSLLDKHKKEFRKSLGNKIGKQVRIVPEIAFFLDETQKKAQGIEDLIAGLDIPPADPED